MSGKTVGVVLTRFRSTVAAKKQDEQRERSSVANVVVGTEDQWECEWVKPGGQCDPERERRLDGQGIWDAHRHHRVCKS